MTDPNPGRSPSWKWWVCGALLLATFLNYMDRQALAVTLPELKDQYHLGEARIGLLEGYFGRAFALGSILFGLIADRVGPRRLYPLVLVGWSVAGIATSYAGDPRTVGWLERPGDEPGTGTFYWLLICRTALGLFEAGHWPCALITARQILTAKDRPLGNGILQSGASLGAIAVPLYAEVVQRLGFGWQFVFSSIGVAGLAWVGLWAALIRRGDLDGPPPPAAEPVGTLGWGAFLRRLAVLAVVVSCLNVSWQFLRAWLPLYLQDFHGYSREATRLVTAGYFITTDVGCILAGFLVQGLVVWGLSVDTARRVGFAGFAGLTALAALVPYVGSGPMMIVMLFTAGAGILGLHPYYYAFTQELPARHMGVLSGGLAAVGWVVSGQFQIEIGAEIQRQKSYEAAFLIVGAAPMLALVVLLVFGRRQPVSTR